MLFSFVNAASLADPFSRSKLMPRISSPCEWYCLYAAVTLGNSARHGPHHMAQKSSRTTLPLKSSGNFTVLPSVVLATNAEAYWPTAKAAYGPSAQAPRETDKQFKRANAQPIAIRCAGIKAFMEPN